MPSLLLPYPFPLASVPSCRLAAPTGVCRSLLLPAHCGPGCRSYPPQSGKMTLVNRVVQVTSFLVLLVQAELCSWAWSCVTAISPSVSLLTPILSVWFPQAGMNTPAEQAGLQRGPPVPESPDVFCHQTRKRLSSPGFPHLPHPPEGPLHLSPQALEPSASHRAPLWSAQSCLTNAKTWKASCYSSLAIRTLLFLSQTVLVMAQAPSHTRPCTTLPFFLFLSPPPPPPRAYTCACLSSTLKRIHVGWGLNEITEETV